MTNAREWQYQKLADIQTLFCIASTGPLILFLMFGPKEGMETLGIIIPWLFAGLVNLVLGLLALVNAFKARAPLRNAWIYSYFILFFGFNGYYMTLTTTIDVDIARRVDNFRQPQESEFWQLLRRMDYMAIGGKDLESAQLTARELVRQGVDLSYIRPGTQRPLIVMAARKGDPELVRMMLDRGADVTGPVSSIYSYTPIQQAVSNGRTAVVKVLLEYGAQPNDDRYEYTLLSVAAKNSDVPTARLLLAAGASDASSVLFTAVRNRDSQMIKLLLDHGADPDIIVHRGFSPVLNAVQAGCVECVRLLVGAGGKALGHTDKGETVLVLAIKQGQKEIIDILSASATPPGSAKDLFYAVNHQDLQLLETLLALGVSPDTRDDDGDTVLLYLSTRSQYRRQVPEVDVATARVMIAHGADINASGKYGETPLYRAAKTGAVEMALLLIEKGADINAATDNGWTPLKVSLMEGYQEISSALIDAGADPNMLVK